MYHGDLFGRGFWGKEDGESLTSWVVSSVIGESYVWRPWIESLVLIDERMQERCFMLEKRQ